MSIKKPIKVCAGEFLTGSNFEVLTFTKSGALAVARQHAKQLTNSCLNRYKFKVKGIKDCGTHWRYTIQ